MQDHIGKDEITGNRMHCAARYWSTLDNGRIRCELCPRMCELHAGQRGFCFVRMNDAGSLVLTTYGRSSGFCVDPIEKKPLNHFLPGTPVLSFGTAGCNLSCRFCQNWDISTSRKTDTLADAAGPTDIAETAGRLHCRSVAYTYNDPVIFLEYAVDVAQACHERGIRNVAVTAGYLSERPREEFFSVMDAANVDLKAFTESFYRNICGGSLESVKETLTFIAHETRVWLEITTLLIPGGNDSDAEIDRLSAWVAGALGTAIPLHFTAFHPDWRMRDRVRTPPSTLSRARKIAMRNGLRYVYTGNVYDPQGGSTRCHACGAMLVERNGYEIMRWGLVDGGRCASCGAACPGVFEEKPGTWGARRLPVRIS